MHSAEPRFEVNVHEHHAPAPANVFLVIPTLSSSRVADVRALCESARGVGIGIAVFANGASAFEQLSAAGVPVLSAQENLGFAGGVNRAAASRPESAEWIIVMNDDVEVQDFSIFIGLDELSNGADVISFGDEPLHKIPGRREVFLSISMLGGLRRRRELRAVEGRVPDDLYAPFSVAAVRASTWTALEGLDERYPFSSEDSDFARRARDAGHPRVSLVRSGIAHRRGETGRANIGRVLPAAVWGGYSYLRRWECGRATATTLALAALVIRVPLVMFSNSPKRQHLVGIFRAMRAVSLDRRPTLPAYDAF